MKRALIASLSWLALAGAFHVQAGEAHQPQGCGAFNKAVNMFNEPAWKVDELPTSRPHARIYSAIGRSWYVKIDHDCWGSFVSTVN